MKSRLELFNFTSKFFSTNDRTFYRVTLLIISTIPSFTELLYFRNSSEEYSLRGKSNSWLHVKELLPNFAADGRQISYSYFQATSKLLHLRISFFCTTTWLNFTKVLSTKPLEEYSGLDKTNSPTKSCPLLLNFSSNIERLNSAPLV